MNAERLLSLYEKVAEAPDAIARLRRFVLDLAVRGKLVTVELESRSYTLGDVGRWGSGGTPTRTNPDYYGGTIPWLVIGDLNDGVVTRAETHITQAGLDNSSAKLIEPGTILIAMYGSIGKLGIAGIRCATNQAIAHCVLDQSIVSTDYFLVLLRSLREDFLSKGQGVAQQNISQKILKAWPVQLPLVGDQQRIVAKVEELMALLDQLEAARTAREATRDRLTAASLARLTAPDTNPAEFPSYARFALDTLPPLTARLDQIKRLRKTILNLSTRGRLVKQDPSDESALQLLNDARRAKTALREQRNIRRGENPEYSESLGEANAPKHWAWANLADFALVLGGKRLPAGASFAKEPTKHIYIRVTDMKAGTIAEDEIKFISSEVHKKIAKYTINQEDIYITIAGTIGEVGKVPAIFDGQNLTENAAKIVFREVSRDFLILALRSDDVQRQFSEKTKQMAQPKLALKRILGARVPIPPLTEQHRIVAKVEALMALCDRLEATLATADSTRARLLEALLHETVTTGTDNSEAA